MDESFPFSAELTDRHLRQVALRELLTPSLFEPVTPNEWQQLQLPQPQITQL